MDKKSRDDFIIHIAQNPLEGELITGTGGARKIRWTADSHQGKSGGSRVIYYYHNQDMPIFYLRHMEKVKKKIFQTAKRIY